VIEKSPLVQRLQKELQASHDKIASLAKELEVARFESEEYLRQASQVASDLMEQEQRLKALQDSHEAIKQDEVRHLQELEEMTAELKERNAEIGSLRKQRELAEKNVVQMIHCFQVIKGKWKEQVRRTNQLEEENRVLQGHLDENRKMVQSLQQEHRCHQEAAAQVRVSVTQKVRDDFLCGHNSVCLD